MTLIPGAVLDPGRHWNGAAGWFNPAALFQHYTVGRDSRALIRNNGLAPILIWDDVIWQFAPLEAVCFTQCEWNRWGIGIEVESLDGSITAAQIQNLSYVVLFALVTFGIPQVFYDGPRLPVGFPYYGVTNHRNLVHRACDQHYDGFDQWVWEAMTGAPPVEVDMPQTAGLFQDDRGAVWVYDGQAFTKTWVPTQTALDAIRGHWTYLGWNADLVRNATTDAILTAAPVIGPDPWNPETPGAPATITGADVAGSAAATASAVNSEPREIKGVIAGA
jgi:hypothetical protein